MVREADDLIFLVVEEAAFELARDRHYIPPLLQVQAEGPVQVCFADRLLCRSGSTMLRHAGVTPLLAKSQDARESDGYTSSCSSISRMPGLCLCLTAARRVVILERVSTASPALSFE